jgi:hypothetical protein
MDCGSFAKLWAQGGVCDIEAIMHSIHSSCLACALRLFSRACPRQLPGTNQSGRCEDPLDGKLSRKALPQTH